MKSILLIIILMLSVCLLNGQAPDWLWAQRAGGAYSDKSAAIAIDASANLYITGYFSSSSITFGTITLTNVGSCDIFVAKYNSSGNSLWAKEAAGKYCDNGLGISTDGRGNVYVTGRFFSDSITFGSITLTNAGSGDIFVVKYDSSGNVLWAKGIGGTDDDQGIGITTDAKGNVYVTGQYSSDSITFGSVTLTNAKGGYGDIFMVKYDSSGNVLWAKGIGGTHYDASTSIATFGNGSVYATGWFYDDSINFDSTILINSGESDVFVVKYDSSGNVQWAKGIGGTYDDEGTSIATDGSGNVYVTGRFFSDSITFGSITLTNAGSDDIFVVKYDSSGNVQWAKGIGGAYDDKGTSIATDGSGNVYVTGRFFSDSITFGSITLTNAGSDDIFVVKYDSSGNVQWAKMAEGKFSDVGASIVADEDGNVYVTGWFWGNTMNFGFTTLINAGNEDIFVTKLSSAVGIEEVRVGDFGLKLINYPNPFTSKSKIEYTLLQNGFVSVNVYDLIGRKVVSLVNEKQSKGEHQIIFDGSNLRSGMYFCELNTCKYKSITKLILLK